jgi:fatty acid desaturase
MKTSNSKPAAGAGLSLNDPRETMRRLPRWLQPLLTELTGKAPSGEKPWPRWSTAGRLAATLFVFVASIAASMMAIRLGGWAWALLPLTWLLTVSATRVFQTGLVHHASHGRLLVNEWANEFFGELLSLLAWLTPLGLYRLFHDKHHSGLGGPTDPDLRFVVSRGLKPGLTVKQYWRQFWRTLFSPGFHASFLAARLQENFLLRLPREFATGALSPKQARLKEQFLYTRPARRAASVAFALALLAGAAVSGGWWELALGYLLPITILTQMSAWAGLLGLHQWTPAPGAESKRAAQASLTSGRFVGEAAPDGSQRGWLAARAWAGFTLRMLTTHLFQRLAVVPGELPSHDWHHEVPVSWEWANHAYARRDRLAQDETRRPAYTEFWGVGRAIEATFERLAALPPSAQLREPLTNEERREVLSSM